MSTDFMVFGKGTRATRELVPLGSRSSVLRALRAAFPALRWDGDTWAELVGDDFSMELSIPAEDLVESIATHMRGVFVEPLADLVALAESVGWEVLDLQDGTVIEPDEFE